MNGIRMPFLWPVSLIFVHTLALSSRFLQETLTRMVIEELDEADYPGMLAVGVFISGVYRNKDDWEGCR